MTIIKVAIIGLGNMGQAHVHDVLTLPELDLVALCDVNEARISAVAAKLPVSTYQDYNDLLANESLDAVIIATPHYSHTPITIAALQRGLHVLVEKPLAVHVNDGHKMLAAYEAALQTWPNLQLGTVFMQRIYGYYRKIKELITSGELGRLVRVTWIITDWFRTQAYFDSGGWRATWSGEGGGVLFNQSPHNLDLYQWMFGMPDQVTGFVSLGKYHNIEVEDEVTAYFAHNSGLVGHFITSTAEAPGTNRLEVVGEQGKLILENENLTFFRNRKSMLAQIIEAKGGFDKGESWQIDLPFPPHNSPGHLEIIANFARAISDGEPLIAPAAEALSSVMLANAIMLSSFKGQTINLPVKGGEYEAKLDELVRNSRFSKNEIRALDGDISQSFQ